MTTYLAGGINGLTDDQATTWRAQARALLNGDVLDPMARDYRGHEDANVTAIVEGDLADIAQCDAILAWCPRPSWGTAMEIHHAHTRGLPVIAVVPPGVPVSPWLRYHTTAVVHTVADAVTAIREMTA
ncbi:nucleoside 2-deoxyribosyltransferase [Streptomyces sp. NPDC003300]|uniref:nucleoside 2-deoxyribosyltransferase n=1 Tax=unclassified Streptomyces TaxID=2593676 RepID=UPI0033B42573